MFGVRFWGWGWDWREDFSLGCLMEIGIQLVTGLGGRELGMYQERGGLEKRVEMG